MDLYFGEYGKRLFDSIYNFPQEDKEHEQKYPVFKDNSFKINDNVELQQSQMLFLEFEESIFKPFEIFHGQFVLFGTEIEPTKSWKDKYNFYEPYKLSFKLQYPRKDGSLIKLTEELHIYKYIRKHYPNGNTYPFQSETSSFPSHTYIEFWAIPDYVIKLMKFPLKQRSFKDKTFKEIIEDILKEFDIKCNSPDYKHDQKYKLDDLNIQNRIPIQNPLVIPQGMNFFNFLEWVRLRLWSDQKDYTSFPFIYFNHGHLNILVPDVSPQSCNFKLHLGDKWLEISDFKKDTVNIIDSVIDKMNKDFILSEVEYVSRNRGTIYNFLQQRSEKHILKGDMQEKLPFKYKQIKQFNSFIPEPTFSEFQKEYKDYWEYHQWYLQEEMDLESRMGLIYNTILYNYYYNMDYFKTGFNNFTNQEMLEKLPLGLQFSIKLWDSQFVGTDREMNEEIFQVVSERKHFIVPPQGFWQVEVHLGTDSKWNIFKEDPHSQFYEKKKVQCKESEQKTYSK